MDNVYMDNICDSVTTVEEAQRLTNEIDQVLQTGGFSVKGWISNKRLTQKCNEEMKKGISLFQEEEKVLGISWNCESDRFHFRVRTDLFKILNQPNPTTPKITKRVILSHIARIGMQQLWQLGLDWDEELPPAVQEKWISLFQEIKELDDVSFERSLLASTVFM